tara:strand:- start:299 stop:490 length:192 start_codon:yes stop_codon:yes gene_type:complete
MPNLSKYDVLHLLAKSMPSYSATQWLKTANKALEGKVPSDLLKEGEVEKVYAQLDKEIKKKKK